MNLILCCWHVAKLSESWMCLWKITIWDHEVMVERCDHCLRQTNELYFFLVTIVLCQFQICKIFKLDQILTYFHNTRTMKLMAHLNISTFVLQTFLTKYRCQHFPHTPRLIRWDTASGADEYATMILIICSSTTAQILVRYNLTTF